MNASSSTPKNGTVILIWAYYNPFVWEIAKVLIRTYLNPSKKENSGTVKHKPSNHINSNFSLNPVSIQFIISGSVNSVHYIDMWVSLKFGIQKSTSNNKDHYII